MGTGQLADQIKQGDQLDQFKMANTRKPPMLKLYFRSNMPGSRDLTVLEKPGNSFWNVFVFHSHTHV